MQSDIGNLLVGIAFWLLMYLPLLTVFWRHWRSPTTEADLHASFVGGLVGAGLGSAVGFMGTGPNGGLGGAIGGGLFGFWVTAVWRLSPQRLE